MKPNGTETTKGSCEMNVVSGPDYKFEYSSISRKKVKLSGIWYTLKGPVTNPVFDAAPTVQFNHVSGEVRIWESFRALDGLGNVVKPDIHVARKVTLKAGEWRFPRAETRTSHARPHLYLLTSCRL